MAKRDPFTIRPWRTKSGKTLRVAPGRRALTQDRGPAIPERSTEHMSESITPLEWLARETASYVHDEMCETGQSPNREQMLCWFKDNIDDDFVRWLGRHRAAELRAACRDLLANRRDVLERKLTGADT